MGSLTPGATYIYERVGDTVYARESGSDPSTRVEIGWNVESTPAPIRSKYDQMQEDKLWGNIRRAAKDDLALHAALERVILIYHLSKDNNAK